MADKWRTKALDQYRRAMWWWGGPKEAWLECPHYAICGLEGITAAAYEFPQIRRAYRRLGRNAFRAAGGDGRCPRCRIKLVSRILEGVPVKACPGCRQTPVAVQKYRAGEKTRLAGRMTGPWSAGPGGNSIEQDLRRLSGA